MSAIYSFEGLDGVGKSTLIDLVKFKLETEGKKVVILREPGTTLMGEAIRDLIKSDTPRAPLSEVLLFLASRADMVETTLNTAMKHFDYVLIDRYIDSTIAYQGYGNGIDVNFLQHVNNAIIGSKGTPKRTYYITTPEDIVFKRLAERDDQVKDKAEVDLEFRQRVQDGYRQLQRWYPDRIVEIENLDLDQAVEEIYDDMLGITEHRREILASQNAKSEGPATYRAIVQRYGWNHEAGEPTLLLTHVKRKWARQISTDHLWVAYDRELLKAGPLFAGDSIEFTADIHEYQHTDLNGSVYLEYGLTNVSNVTVLKRITLPNMPGIVLEEDLSRIWTQTNEDIYKVSLERHVNFMRMLHYKYLGLSSK